MTLMILLGGLATAYILSLLLRLVIHALPVGIAVCVAVTAYGHGAGLGSAAILALMSGAAVIAVAKIASASSSPPLLRLGVALAFAMPAAIAGYHAIAGLLSPIREEGIGTMTIGGIGAVMFAWAAGRAALDGGGDKIRAIERRQRGHG